MITQFIMQALLSLLKLIFAIVPDLPALPDSIVDGTSYMASLIGDTVGIVSYLFTPALTVFVFTAILVVLNFHSVYHLVMFIVRKLPIGSH